MKYTNLTDIINTSAAISPRTGQKAFSFVASHLTEFPFEILSISFDGITDCTSAFCNSFVGKLYMDFDPQLLDAQLQFEGLEKNELWFKKIHNAKLLGSNENIRSNRQSSIDELMFS